MAGADVMLVGLFSAKDKAVDTKLDVLAALVETFGGRVVGRGIAASHGTTNHSG